MKKITLQLVAISAVLFSTSCQETKKSEPIAQESQQELVEEKVVESIMTAEDQAGMTPGEIVGRLKKGNENFMNNNLTQRDHSAQRRKAMIGQYPKAIVLSCVDSRVPVEDVFDLGIGDIFVARVAGNIENADIVGSMEFATAVAGSKVVIVMGHTACGAVKSTIDEVDAKSLGMNALADLLDEIEPAIKETKFEGDRTTKNIEYTDLVINNNAMRTVKNIRQQSPTMAKMEDDGKIMIVSALYDMETGKVTFNKD
ncbi:carbonic anhydrase family protein [Cellulophaga tyrosinoxydans]|uniref:Carbonic anhydrase n=1 Tax=Cellulophaga tyrosinoxydans TaxID=504486 RepID=A0A1W2CTT6_9FLAO|nr:carbonic anhydrase family protein [Cellulophaga tyrosinoxydans]SMC88640.1 carbonic anhydrase [Cellulophaga tyrosinoxydans]